MQDVFMGLRCRRAHALTHTHTQAPFDRYFTDNTLDFIWLMRFWLLGQATSGVARVRWLSLLLSNSLIN